MFLISMMLPAGKNLMIKFLQLPIVLNILMILKIKKINKNKYSLKIIIASLNYTKSKIIIISSTFYITRKN
jgi:hypothetical protein